MIELLYEPLSQHVRIRCGGICSKMLVPESEAELIECLKKHDKIKILGAGSNVIPNDRRLKYTIIKSTKACLRMERYEQIVYVGSSVKLSAFVRFLVSESLFGYEYLVSVPGNIGGSVYMNAGRGREWGLSISNYLKKVKIWDGKNVQYIEKHMCEFGYRKSVFQRKKNWVILEAEFLLPEQTKEVGLKKIRERLMDIEKWQDLKHPNCGSIFSHVSSRAVKEMMGVRRGDAAFSEKTPNWLVNLGNPKTSNFLYLINLMRIKSLFYGIIPRLELEIWR